MNKTLITNYEIAIANIREELTTYILKNKLSALVIGISGGIDSALCVALAKPVCNRIGIPLIGRFISISTNKEDEIERAKRIGQEFCHDYSNVDLTKEYETMSDALECDEEWQGEDIRYKIRHGNIKARMRMMYLYNLASLHNGLVLSTDNLTELLLGFWTLHGDVGDLGMIQQLWKTEVYEMSEYIANNEYPNSQTHRHPASQVLIDTILCNATDGLGITKTDLDQILPNWRNDHKTTRDGYKEVDELIDMYISTGKYPKNEKKIVSERIVKSAFKRDNPHNFTREQIIKNI